MDQSGVGNLGVPQAQHFELRQRFERSSPAW